MPTKSVDIPTGPPALATPGEIDPEDALEAIDEVNGGFHPPLRPAHARGTICVGTFTALERARSMTRAAQMKGEPVRALIRFSNAAADPGVPDSTPDARGMAVRLSPTEPPQDGEPEPFPIDIVAVTMPCFFVNEPQDFVKFTRCFKNGGAGRVPKARLRKLLPFLVQHRETLQAVRAMRKLKPVRSYAQCRYNALHAYEWINDGGGPPGPGPEHQPRPESRYVRYSWIPEEGEAPLSKREAAGLSPDYLQKDLIDRLGRTPARPFRLQLAVQFARKKVDHEDLPAVPWSGEEVVVGELEVTGLYESDDKEPLVFDPTRTTPGIALSDDRILRFRSPVYERSVERRSKPQQQPAP